MSGVASTLRSGNAVAQAAGGLRATTVWARLREKLMGRDVGSVASDLMRVAGLALTWRQHQTLVRVLNQAGTRQVRKAFPRVQYRYTLPYLSTDLGWHERWDALVSHYAFVNRHFAADFSRRVLDDNLPIWQADVDGEAISVSLQGLCRVTRHREGELTLCFKLGSEAIYKLSFSIVRVAGLNLPGVQASAFCHALYVGRVQGVQGAMDAIRRATGLLGDIAPQDLLMAVLAGMASALGINTLIGVGDDTCVSRDSIERSGSSFRYDVFWARYAARELEGGHHLISLPAADKPLAEIPAKHRKRTQRKRDLKRQVATSCEQAFRAWLA